LQLQNIVSQNKTHQHNVQFNIPDDNQSIITVVGVGGGGSNAVNYMFNQGIVGVDFAICNTDNQAINLSPIPTKIQLGPSLTEGRGAGSKPVVGREACHESIEDIKQLFSNHTKMLFVTAGMGGGTGTGAAPVIARAAREMDILTVGIVTTPFAFEGRRRAKQAEEGIAELKKNVDTLIIVSNDKLRKIYGNLALAEAFAKADDILTIAAKGIAEIITKPGYVNVDFEDVNTVMRDSGVAVMGTATMAGEDRAIRAAEAALQSPLLEDNDIRGAQHILLNITSGTQEVTMDEVSEITEYVQEAAGYGTDLIWGNCFDESLGEKITVTIIATGFETGRNKEAGKTNNANTTFATTTKNNPQHNNTYTPPVSNDHKTTRVSLDDDDFPSNRYGQDYDADKKKDKYVIKPLDPIIPVEKKTVPISNTPKNPVPNSNNNATKSGGNYGDSNKNFASKLENPETLNELENQPAYLRKGIKLDEVSTNIEHRRSNWSIGEDEPELRDSNSFLHDNID
jgi:cell division protein FtsZ